MLDFAPIESSSLEEEEFLVSYYTQKADELDELEDELQSMDEIRKLLQSHGGALRATNTTTNSTPSTSKAGIYKMTTLGGLMGFMRGYWNGTRTLVTNNMTKCENLVVTKWDQGASKLVNNTLDGNLFNAGWNLLDMIYNIHPITLSCYVGNKEGFWGLVAYTYQLYPSAVIDNVVYNFGNIFDAFRDTILFFTASSRGEFNLPYEAGYASGAATW